jgi:hypothetical protein
MTERDDLGRKSASRSQPMTSRHAGVPVENNTRGTEGRRESGHLLSAFPYHRVQVLRDSNSYPWAVRPPVQDHEEAREYSIPVERAGNGQQCARGETLRRASVRARGAGQREARTIEREVVLHVHFDRKNVQLPIRRAKWRENLLTNRACSTVMKAGSPLASRTGARRGPNASPFDAAQAIISAQGMQWKKRGHTKPLNGTSPKCERIW